MKKTKLIIAVGLLVVVCAFLSKGLFDFVVASRVDEDGYNTPEEAIINTLNTTEYKLVESNDTFLAVCNTDVNTYNCQYIFKNDEGWNVVTDKMFANAYCHYKAKDNKFNVFVREYTDKYTITVVQDEYSINNNGLFYVEDSINSDFQELEYSIVMKEHFWYICLDNIPNDYVITVSNGSGHKEVVSIK